MSARVNGPDLSLRFAVLFKNCPFKFAPITLTKLEAYCKTGGDILKSSIHRGRHYNGNDPGCRSSPVSAS